MTSAPGAAQIAGIFEAILPPLITRLIIKNNILQWTSEHLCLALGHYI